MEIRKLNMLRGLAALMVIVSHFSNQTQVFGGLLGSHAGQLGVMVFFILSGFLMSYLYMDQRVANRETVWRFAIARIARVFPLFFIVVILSYLLPKLGIGGIFYHVPDLPSLVAHIGLLNGASVLWTVSTEIQFYGIFVLLWIVQAKNKSLLYVLFVAVVLGLAVYGLPSPRFTVMGLGIDTKLVRSLPYFLVGIIFGQAYHHWRPPTSFRSHAFILSFGIIALLYPKIFRQLTGQYHYMWQDVGVLAAVSLFFFLFLFFVPDDNRFFANPIGDFLGKISYSVYLLHYPILRIIRPLGLPTGLYFVVSIVAIFTVSYGSYCLIEDPARKFIRAIAIPAKPAQNIAPESV